MAERDEAFKEEDVKRLLRQILEGVSFLHRNNVVHLDLKVMSIYIYRHLSEVIYSVVVKALHLYKYDTMMHCTKKLLFNDSILFV